MLFTETIKLMLSEKIETKNIFILIPNTKLYRVYKKEIYPKNTSLTLKLKTLTKI